MHDDTIGCKTALLLLLFQESCIYIYINMYAKTKDFVLTILYTEITISYLLYLCKNQTIMVLFVLEMFQTNQVYNYTDTILVN